MIYLINKHKHLVIGFQMAFKKSNYQVVGDFLWFGWVNIRKVRKNMLSNKLLLKVLIKLTLKKYGLELIFLNSEAL